MTWIMTCTGRRINFLNPDPDEINEHDIAMALSRNHRFGGHSPLKIGQHICEVATLMIEELDPGTGEFTLEMAEAGLIGLIHDFPEYAVVDVPTPLKKLLGEPYEEIETRLLSAMLDKWDLHGAWNTYYPLLKKHDQNAVEQEATRFRLDGWWFDFDGAPGSEWVKRQNDWTPTDKELTLSDYVWDEDEAYTHVKGWFFKLLVLSDRKHMANRFVLNSASAFAEKSGLSVEEALLYTNPLVDPLLLSGKTYF